MLFTSDLDRTLIYSKKFFNESINLDKDLVLVEEKDGIGISYMSKNAVRLLKEVNESVLFVPVTTRTIEQYSRIAILQKEIIPKYAIVSNGGNILIEGVINTEWNNNIQKLLKKNCLPFEDVLLKFNKELRDDSWILREYGADDLFFYFIINPEKIPYDKIYDFEIWVKENKWTLSIQGRKLYLIPNCVDKWNAISHLCDIEGVDRVIAAGDSLLDLKMLNKANYSLSPNHGEIKNRVFDSSKNKSSIEYTKRSGFRAAEDILENIKKYISN